MPSAKRAVLQWTADFVCVCVCVFFLGGGVDGGTLQVPPPPSTPKGCSIVSNPNSERRRGPERHHLLGNQ